MEDLTEPERSYPNVNSGPFLLINGLLLGIVALLFVAASKEEGYLGGLLEMMAVMGLMGLGTLINLILAATTQGSRVGYLLMTALYGVVFFFFMSAFSHMGSLKPGG